MPYLLTRSSILGIVFTETGQIGDTLGGITAPFIGIFSIVLLVKTLASQNEFNRKQQIKEDYNTISLLMRDIQKSCADLEVVRVNNSDGALFITDIGVEFLNYLDSKTYPTIAINIGHFKQLHINVMYIASQRALIQQMLKISLLDSVVTKSIYTSIEILTSPIVDYLARYEKEQITIKGSNISNEQKVQAKEMLNALVSNSTTEST
jgi:hypothetical protein